ncbi:MAG: hypothetical protein QG622_1669 [Actinomycetota bacterium]|nr:hypothetical protein [Actinomycetota bacterium]
MTVGRWLRRNAWAFPVMVAVLALSSFSECEQRYDAYRRDGALVASRPGADGWAGYGGARVRLVRLREFRPVDYARVPVALPPGTTAWEAELEFDLPSAEALSGCQIRLRSGSGWIYTTNPAELRRMSGRDFVNCAPDDPGKNPGRQIVAGRAHFVVPATESPGAVEVIRATLLPRYAELPSGAT